MRALPAKESETRLILFASSSTALPQSFALMFDDVPGVFAAVWE